MVRGVPAWCPSKNRKSGKDGKKEKMEN